uniref:THUMP domain-containing protein n=2 Tax=Tetranychus urticae TaxID=32264 RepID=T1K5M9_TETUR
MSGASKSDTHGGKGQKRKKNYYKSFTNKRTKFTPFKEGVKGFLVSCNKSENHAVREAYQLLNKYTEELEDLELAAKNSGSNEDVSIKKETGENKAVKVEDIELDKELAKEVDKLKEVRRRFNQLTTKTHNVIFIEAKENSLDPNAIVSRMFDDIKNNSTTNVKFCLKMLPVITTCSAHIETIKKTCMNLLENQPEEASYYIIPKVRAHDGITREEIIQAIGDAVAEKREKWTPDFDNAKLTIVVNIVNKFCCFSILSNFNQLKKYNPVEYTLARGSSTQASEDIKNENKDESGEAEKSPSIGTGTGTGKIQDKKK